MTLEQLAALLPRFGLEAHAGAILDAARPAVELVPALRPVAAGSSRFGGAPELIAGQTWPEHEGMPLQFAAQLRLSEVPRLPGMALPHDGLLSFFALEDPDRGARAGRVLYAAPGAHLVPATPHGAHSSARTLTLRATLDLPQDEYQAPYLAQMPKDAVRRHAALRSVLQGGDHRLLGWPTHRTLAYDPHPGPGWLALLTLDSDDDLGWTWADGDTLMYFVRDADLERGYFGAVEIDMG